MKRVFSLLLALVMVLSLLPTQALAAAAQLVPKKKSFAGFSDVT